MSIINSIKNMAKAYNAFRINRHLSISQVLHGRVFVDAAPGTMTTAKSIKRVLAHNKILFSNGFAYPFDENSYRYAVGVSPLVSTTIDYETVLDSSLTELAQNVFNGGDVFSKVETSVINSLQKLARRIDKEATKNSLCCSISSLLESKPKSLAEAYQKILFYHGVLYQVGQFHNGLGRLDLILAPYYKHDTNNGVSWQKIYELSWAFIKVLCQQSRAKSVSLLGDTGQYILLSGVDKNGETVDNELTRIFLQIFKEHPLPDPKLIVRVNEHTSDNLWTAITECIMEGSGSPLIMNETPIMKSMVEFGYDSKDVWNVGTSACWEPLVIGKSACQNNPFRSINVCMALMTALEESTAYATFDSLLAKVKDNLKQISKKVVVSLKFDCSPVMSLFSVSSIAQKKDFSQGGSDYMYQGAQAVGMPNLVNSLLNIKEYVFDMKTLTLTECFEAIRTNFENREDLRTLFSKASELKYGNANDRTLPLTNELVQAISEAVEQTTSYNHKVKFGLSSPNYINVGKYTPATFDGRLKGEPLAVHLSPVSSTIGISEILDFAAQIDYPVNCLNGNVVDFIVPSSYKQQKQKFSSLLKASVLKGVFEIQLNVMDKQTLIDAKQHPEKYPNLIVRVWGFSAYFNDLPEEYKDNLIARCEMYEAV